MSPAVALKTETKKDDDTVQLESLYQKGVKHLCDSGINQVPNKYIWPVSDRPNVNDGELEEFKKNLKLPIIDFSELQGSNRPQVLESLANACEQYGFFQVGLIFWLIWFFFQVSLIKRFKNGEEVFEIG